MSKPGPGVIKKEWVASMADDAILFVIANPVPEIWPWEALEAGARVVATGRSDFPNQVNNSLGFPGIFRGTLDVRARTITDEMCIAAAAELAKVQEEEGLDETHIVPTMDNTEVFIREAVAVGLKAIDQGIASVALGKKSLELDPDLDMVYYSLGRIYFEKGEYAASEEVFRKFLEIYPYFPEVHNLLAIVYAAQKQFDKAVGEF